MKDNTGSARVLIGLGSNINPAENLQAAIDLLKRSVKVIAEASTWQSPAFGHQGPDYLNTALLLAAEYSLRDLENNLLRPIEDQLGRVRGPNKYVDRTIDLDVLVYNQEVIDPEIWSQAHAALPAAEILPHLINPATGLTLAQTALKLEKSADIFARADL